MSSTAPNRVKPVAVIPVKNFINAKQRLSPVLSPEMRRRLFKAMLEDVLEALLSCKSLAGVSLVTGDAQARELASHYGAGVIAEAENRGHTEAVVHGARALVAQGVGSMLTVPGDIPLVTASEIDRLVQTHGDAPAVTIGPARDKLGSNAVLVSPPDVMPFRFGDNSYYPHLHRARDLGIEPAVVECAGIGLDVDTPEDLAELMRRPGQTRAQRLLIALNTSQ